MRSTAPRRAQERRQRARASRDVASMVERDASCSGKDLEALRLGAAGDGPEARPRREEVGAGSELVAVHPAAEVEVVRPRDVLVEEAPDADEARAALL